MHEWERSSKMQATRTPNKIAGIETRKHLALNVVKWKHCVFYSPYPFDLFFKFDI